MVVLISGASHAGKTILAQKLMEKYLVPYVSIDHIKMGLIRSKVTTLTPEDDDKLTEYLWPIVSEMAKTAIENKQSLIIEGCYIPANWRDTFEDEYLQDIKHICIVLSREYILSHFDDIKKYACIIEQRLDDDWCTLEMMLEENAKVLNDCEIYGTQYVLIDGEYNVDIEL